MQTFLPYPSFVESAKALDNKRLCCQVKEVHQILVAIIAPGKRGWKMHPVVDMWRGYEVALLVYGAAMYKEWQARYDDGRRGGKRKHKSGEKIMRLLAFAEAIGAPVRLPRWLCDKSLHAMYRRLLLEKNPEFYCNYQDSVLS